MWASPPVRLGKPVTNRVTTSPGCAPTSPGPVPARLPALGCGTYRGGSTTDTSGGWPIPRAAARRCSSTYGPAGSSVTPQTAPGRGERARVPPRHHKYQPSHRRYARYAPGFPPSRCGALVTDAAECASPPQLQALMKSLAAGCDLHLYLPAYRYR